MTHLGPPTDALPESPTERHRAVAGNFAAKVSATQDWDAPSPVSGWAARDVVGHLVGWFPAFLAAGGIVLPAGPDVAVNPVLAWQHQTNGVQELIESRGDESFTHPYVGTHTLVDAVNSFYTADVFMHTWDLARATGQEPDLDEVFAATLLEGMRPIEGMLRSSGQYGAAVPVAAGASLVEQLMGFIGRDPAWRP